MDMGGPIGEIPEWYPWESDGECWSLHAIELDEDIVEDDVDREDDREDTSTLGDLASSCEELEVDLYE